MLLIDDVCRSLHRSFQKQATVFGKCSVIAFGVIFVLGFCPAAWVLLRPQELPSSDCMASPFLAESDVRSVWFQALYMWQSLFVALFLIAVATIGHSITSCFLLFCAPTTNILLWTVAIRPAVLVIPNGDEQVSTMECWTNTLYQIGFFWILTVIAFGGSILETYSVRHEASYATVPDALAED